MRSIDYQRVPSEGDPFFNLFVTKSEYQKLQPGLSPGTRGLPSRFDVLAVVVDLEGFTEFCAQPDAHQFVRRFVREFEDWLFGQLRSQLEYHSDPGNSAAPKGRLSLSAPPPLFSKFLGDGFMFLWLADHEIVGQELKKGAGKKVPSTHVEQEIDGDMTNTVSVLVDIVRAYPAFFDTARKNHTAVPSRLRCGAAKGTVVPLITGKSVDFVGPCINKASRLQKLGPLGLAVAATGLSERFEHAPRLNEMLVRQEVYVRGIGPSHVFVDRLEWESLSDGARKKITEGRD